MKKRLALVDYRDVHVDEAARTVKLTRAGQKVTLGGIAKGYAVDAAVKALRDGGVNDFIVQAGGDLYAGGKRGDREWVVGIQNPRADHGPQHQDFRTESPRVDDILHRREPQPGGDSVNDGVDR